MITALINALPLMLYYLLSNFFSALSNTLGVFLVKNDFFPIDSSQMMDLFLHCDVWNFVFFIILYSFKRQRGQIDFTFKETFFHKEELVQLFLFALPVIAACYKTYMMGFINISNIAISAMIKPFLVWFLAVILLHEKFNKNYIFYSSFAILGFVLTNYSKLHVNYIYFLTSYVLIASFGDVTRRYYCRQRKNTMQAICAECLVFFIYCVIIMSIRGTFDLKLLFNPYTILISFLTFSHHVCLIHGVKKASSVVALEFVNFSKTIFTLIFSFILLHDVPTLNKFIGVILIVISIILFHKEERKVKAQLLNEGKKNT